MSDSKRLAKIILVQIESLNAIKPDEPLAVERQLTLIQEIVRDSEALAKAKLQEAA